MSLIDSLGGGAVSNSESRFIAPPGSLLSLGDISALSFIGPGASIRYKNKLWFPSPPT